MDSFDYCILGGGPAGIGCLKALLESGINSVKLFEGRDEILYTLSFMPETKQSSGDFRKKMSGTDFRNFIFNDKSLDRYISLNSRLIALEPEGSTCTISINGIKNIKIHYKNLLVATGAVQSMYGKNLLPGYRGAGIFTTSQISEMLIHFDFNPGKRIAIWGNTEYCSETEYVVKKSGFEAIYLKDEIYSIHGEEHIEQIETIDQEGTKKKYDVDALAVDGGFIMEHKMRKLLDIEWDITKNRAETDKHQKHPEYNNISIAGDAYNPSFNFISQYLNGFNIIGGIL